MLLLSRREGEKIRLTVGQFVIVVTVAEIDRCKVRIGISAPEEVRIMREELLEADRVGPDTKTS